MFAYVDCDLTPARAEGGRATCVVPLIGPLLASPGRVHGRGCLQVVHKLLLAAPLSFLPRTEMPSCEPRLACALRSLHTVVLLSYSACARVHVYAACTALTCRDSHPVRWLHLEHYMFDSRALLGWLARQSIPADYSQMIMCVCTLQSVMNATSNGAKGGVQQTSALACLSHAISGGLCGEAQQWGDGFRIQRGVDEGGHEAAAPICLQGCRGLVSTSNDAV